MHTPRDKTQRRPNCNRRTLREKARETAARRRRRRRPVNEQSSPACMQSRLFRDSIHAPRAGSRPTHMRFLLCILLLLLLLRTKYFIVQQISSLVSKKRKAKMRHCFLPSRIIIVLLFCAFFLAPFLAAAKWEGEGPKCVAKARFFYLARRCAIQKGLVARPRPPPMGSFSVFSSPR